MMCENLFIRVQSLLSTMQRGCALLWHFCMQYDRMITSTDDRHRGSAALQASRSVAL